MLSYTLLLTGKDGMMVIVHEQNKAAKQRKHAVRFCEL